MSAAPRADNVIRPAAFASDDSATIAAIRRGDRAAERVLFDRHAQEVARILARVLGQDSEISDLVHDVFILVFRDLGRLREPAAFRGWLTSLTVFVARAHIRRKKRKRWLQFLAPEEVPEPAAAVADDDMREAVRCTYAILEKLPELERVAFALRFIEGMELQAIADTCMVSLATIKRRLERAEGSFVADARTHGVLTRWLEGGTRWASA